MVSKSKRRGDEDLDEFLVTYAAALRIDDHALDEEISTQPQQFLEVANKLALFVSRRDAAKKKLGELEAEIDEELRRTARKAKDRITEREINLEIRRNPDYIDAGDEVLTLARAVGRLSALKEAWEQRRYMLREMAGTYASGYWGDAMARASGDAVKGRKAEIAREEMTRARRARTHSVRD